MPRLENPIVLVTRPEADSQRFVDMLRGVTDQFEAIISPAFDYEALSAEIPMFSAAIFTSKVGVAHAPAGNGRKAFCVGDSTAQAAQDAGYLSISASGTAEDLIALILKQGPDIMLMHIRGERSLGDVTARLRAKGLNCHDAVVYRKMPNSPSSNIMSLVENGMHLIIPLFSDETVSILNEWSLQVDGCTIVAISDSVAHSAKCLNPSKIIVSDHPNMCAMAQATARLIA